MAKKNIIMKTKDFIKKNIVNSSANDLKLASNNVVKDALKYLNAANEESRKNDIEDRLDYYYDNYKTLIESELETQFVKENYTNIKVMVDDSINLVEYVTNEVAVIYTKEAKRELSKDSKRYDELKKTLLLDIVMDKANKLTYACNESALVIQPRNDTIELDLLTPNMFSVIQKEGDPTSIDAFIYEVNLADSIENQLTDDVPYKRDADRREFIYYDVQGNHFKFDNNYNVIPNEKNLKNENPYKDKDGKYILPVVILHKKYNENSIFDETSGNKLFSATKQIGVIASLFNYYLKNSSHKQPVITGNADVQIPDNQILDVTKVLRVVGENAGIDLLDFQGNLEEFYQQILHKIELILNQEGLALDDFMKKGTPESGYKLQLKKEPLKKKVNEQKPFYRLYENELFDKIRIVNNTFYSQKIDDNAEFTIDFADLSIDPDPAELRKDREWNMRYNITNPLQIIMDENPDIKTPEDAQKVYDENKAINERLQINTGQINTNLDNKLNQLTNNNNQNKNNFNTGGK